MTQICPHCGRFDKTYSRSITTTMARALIAIYRETYDLPVYVHVPNLLKKYDINPADACIAHLSYWGLVEAQPNTDTPKRKGKGMWIITEKGIDFVQGKIMLPKYKEVYQTEVVGEKGELVSIKDCLKNEFDYSALMAL